MELIREDIHKIGRGKIRELNADNLHNGRHELANITIELEDGRAVLIETKVIRIEERFTPIEIGLFSFSD